MKHRRAITLKEIIKIVPMALIVKIDEDAVCIVTSEEMADSQLALVCSKYSLRFTFAAVDAQRAVYTFEMK